MSATHAEIQFSNDFKSPTLEIISGPYHRLFDRKEEPFIVTLDEFDLHLRPQGKFVVLKRFNPADVPPPAESGAGTGEQATT